MLATVLLTISLISLKAAILIFTGICLAMGFAIGSALNSVIKDKAKELWVAHKLSKDPAYFPDSKRITLVSSIREDCQSIGSFLGKTFGLA